MAGWEPQRAKAVEFSGGADPILPTPFRIGEAAAASLAAVGLAVSDLWELRTGRRQEVAVDARRATASLRSSRYLTLNDAPAAGERPSVMGVYPAKNGRWSYLHCNFPNHREAALGVLGVEEDREAVRRAVAQWDALELEEAIIAANGAGGMVRSMAEWAQHPQSAAVASLPLMEIERIGDCPPQPLPEGDRPLSGIRVLDLTRVLAGPTCARTLAEHGADVMKVSAKHLPSSRSQEYDTGHGKLSTHLDLREEQEVETLRRLVREADVFSQGYRPGTLARRGLSPQDLASLRPGIVYVSLSAFGRVGPWAERRGFDTVVQTVSGITDRQGQLFPGAEPGPQFYPVSAIDYLTGYLMAFGAMLALGRRAREGGSWLVRISLAQVGKWLVEQGQAPEPELRDVPAEFDAAEIKSWSTTSDVPEGRLGHLAPTLQLSETQPYWARPTVPLGYHDPVWPE
ncbi:MAG: CoA transferase [Chloroflexi bacterium]|nr:CoA transferase [Chloroflexota bacterium]MYD49766.1 CoA transferase [Chloroflexota bacterium]